MDGIGLNLTHFTFSFRPSPCFDSGGLPSTSPCVSISSVPPWMIFLPVIFGLPLSHAIIITKGFFSMEITGWPGNFLSAIVTLFCKFILWLTVLVSPLMITRRRTINAVKALKRLKSISASRTLFFDRMNFIFKSWHRTNIIIKNTLSRVGIEIEQKYCDIAIERLRQGVLEF